jgi:hypothetical protein
MVKIVGKGPVLKENLVHVRSWNNTYVTMHKEVDWGEDYVILSSVRDVNSLGLIKSFITKSIGKPLKTEKFEQQEDAIWFPF